jgi:hypothetical protein
MRDDVDFSPLIAQLDELSHLERKLAVRAIINYIRHAKEPRSSRTRLLILRLLRRRPGMLLPLVSDLLR